MTKLCKPKLFYILYLILFLGLFTFCNNNRVDSNCNIYNDFFLSKQKVIDNKYVYFVDSNGDFKESYCTNDCNTLKSIINFYSKNIDSNLREDMTNIRYISPFEYREVLKYNYTDSVAFIKVYNEGARMVKETYTIVSMKCLHDTLPTGYTEYKE